MNRYEILKQTPTKMFFFHLRVGIENTLGRWIRFIIVNFRRIFVRPKKISRLGAFIANLLDNGWVQVLLVLVGLPILTFILLLVTGEVNFDRGKFYGAEPTVERAYFEGQKDALVGDVCIQRKIIWKEGSIYPCSTWIWIKSPWKNDTAMSHLSFRPKPTDKLILSR